MIDLRDMGTGTENDILNRLPIGRWVIIRDDDAATVGDPCWLAGQGNMEKIQTAHEAFGGTVSSIFEVNIVTGNRPGPPGHERQSMETKTLTIRIPIDLWRALKHLQADGEIESINAAAVIGLERIVPDNYRDRGGAE
uniref:Uncharacterized protein n=1 Tax=viral metagenome TaxID=1070528 RepID=A0A6M3J4I3_9ZZZZ